jgi:hypothetical protein
MERKAEYALFQNDGAGGIIYNRQGDIVCVVAKEAKEFAQGLVNKANNHERLLSENKQWETNYNNLSAEFEEVSAIAQSQEKDIAYLKEQLRVEQARNLLHILNKGGE